MNICLQRCVQRIAFASLLYCVCYDINVPYQLSLYTHRAHWVVSIFCFEQYVLV